MEEHMKRQELAPTYNNVIETLRGDYIRRNEVLADFIQLLDKIDGNINIALDSKWGNGKTFFVKQLAVVLEFFRKKAFDQEIDIDLEEIVQHKSYLCDLNPEHTYIPIYYDAWMFDDHPDPILSLMYSIISNGYIESDPTVKHKLREKVAALTSAIASLRGVSLNTEKLFFPQENCLESINFVEEIKDILNDIFEQLIVEKADKLVVIIDELDRCKPDYAVKLLEKIKHFIVDDRVIFIYSTNKEQLIHTIKKFYGQDFNAALYLNRFFDFQFVLDDSEADRYVNYLGRERRFINQTLLSDIGAYFKFSLRDYNIFYSKLTSLSDLGIEYTQASFLYQVFAPLAWAYSVIDIEKERRFLSGDMEDEIIEIMSGIPSVYNFAMRAISNGNDIDKKSRIQALYRYVFNKQKTDDFTTDTLHILSEECKYFLRILGRA